MVSMHNTLISLFILYVNIFSLTTYADCPYCQQGGEEGAVCASCGETLKKIQRTLQGEETDMDLNISIPPCQLSGEFSADYPAISGEIRASIANLASSQPYSLGDDVAGFAIPIVHNILLTLRPQFPGIQSFHGSGEQTILEHTQPAIFSNSITCSEELTSLSSIFITGINNLLQKTPMKGTADSWMSVINTALQSFQDTQQQTSHFVWITEDDEENAGWIFIEIHPNGHSVLFNWNFHPCEKSFVAISKFQSKGSLINYLRAMLRNDYQLHSGFY